MLHIDKNSKTPVYEQIYEHFSHEILQGILISGDVLPATRKLAKDLGISRNTVDRAYQQLKIEGYISSTVGSGFTVNDIPTIPNVKVPKTHSTLLPTAAPSPQHDFIYGSMNSSVFPFRKWEQCTSNVLAKMELDPIIAYPEHNGEYCLQAELCKYLYSARGVVCHPEQVIITGGQQYSMEIICNMFRDCTDYVMEEPGYDGIREVFINHGFTIHPIPVEEDGLSSQALKNISTDLLYLMPSHQFPTGTVLSIAKRRRLINWALEQDAYIIEDDYDSELRYYTNPIPSMQSMDENKRVIYTGTFSKALAPFMRLAYIVLPEKLLPRYYDYYKRYNSHVTSLHQKVVAEFMSRGYYQRHINRLRTLYRKKMDMLIAAIENAFGDMVSIGGGEAGLHILIDVKTNLSQQEMIDRAMKKGIRLYSTECLYMNPSNCPPHQLLLGFPTVDENAFATVMETLRSAWELE